MKQELSYIERKSIFIIFGIALLFFACSCSSRKVQKDETKTDSTANKKEVVEVKEVETIKETTSSDSTAVTSKETQSNNFEDELNFESLNPEKESTITNSKGEVLRFKNAKGSTKKSQSISIEKYNEVSQKLTETETETARFKDSIYLLNEEIALLKSDQSKTIDKEQLNWSTFILSFWWLWLLILLALFIAWKNKDKFIPILRFFK